MIAPRVLDFTGTPDPHLMFAARRYAHRSRVEQGLARRVDDPATVARLATLLRGSPETACAPVGAPSPAPDRPTPAAASSGRAKARRTTTTTRARGAR